MNMKRPNLVFTALAGIWALVIMSSAASPSEKLRPNILWLIAEDVGPQLGCYGTKQVWTPYLDQLANKGVRYTRFFTTSPVCSASRSAFMTGMYQTSIGAQNHRSHPGGVRVLTDWLREAGYFTANIRELPAALGFSGTAKTDWNFTYHGQPFDSERWTDLKLHQPFYAQINFKETHRPFNSAPHADPALVALPAWTPDHPVARADWAKYLDEATELDRKVGLVLQQLETDGLADNTIVVFFGDNGAAHVRAKQFCYEEGLQVPLIIRWPKAFPVPKHFPIGSVDARLLSAIDLAPTMLDIAGVEKPSAMQGEIFLGTKAGRPRRFVFGARDRCDETVFRIRTVRGERYRYLRNFTPEHPFLQANEYKETMYPVWNLLKRLHTEGKLTPAQEFLCAPQMPAEELYDLRDDPDQIHNLVGSPSHARTLRRLRAALERWIEDTHDQGAQFEPPELAAARGVTKALSAPAAKPKQP